MSKRMIIPGAALLLTLGLMFAASVQTARGLNPFAAPRPAVAEPGTQAPDCADGKAVANAIYAHLKKNGFTEKQCNQINVFFKPADKVVSLQGFVSPPNQNPAKRLDGVNRAGTLAAEATTCEVSVDNKLTPFRGRGCTPPRLPCGRTGVCLPPDECNAKK